MLFDLVVPTIGRPSLGVLLEAIGRGGPPFPGRILLVDDRVDGTAALTPPTLASELAARIEILRSGGTGPAGARNTGWRASSAPWVVFLDDDVVPNPDWSAALANDLSAATAPVAASQGRLMVPLPDDRAATDWERNVARLEGAPWITADMAVRRDALERVGGFDERFRRAFREDSDLALRLRTAGYEVALGSRSVVHPVGPADRWVSVRLQEGNADDVLMRALHGTSWEHRTRRGTRSWHVATVFSFLVWVTAWIARRPVVAGGSGVAWLALTARFAWSRIAPGPRTLEEVATMVLTSVVIPFAAVGWRLIGLARLRSQLGDVERRPMPAPSTHDEAVEVTD